MKPLRKRPFHLERYPSDSRCGHRISTEQESDPRGGQSVHSGGVSGTISSKLYRTGVHPPSPHACAYQGKLSCHAPSAMLTAMANDLTPDGPKILATTDTPMCLYSTPQKGITALLMHMLPGRRLINVSTRWRFYAPEFARKGKTTSRFTRYWLIAAVFRAAERRRH